MSADLLLAVEPAWDPALAATLSQVPGARVVRRCADVADLLGVAEAGVGEVAVLFTPEGGGHPEGVAIILPGTILGLAGCGSGDSELGDLLPGLRVFDLRVLAEVAFDGDVACHG